MSQHSQRTQYGPSVASIVTGLVLTLGGGTAVAYILAGPLSARTIVGAVLGAGFTVLIGLQTMERAVERRVALDRIERLAEREEAARREDALRAEWERAVYGPEEAQEPDPVATQPIEPDPLQVEHWATGGAAPEPYDVPVHPLPDGPEPGRYPHHPRPTEVPDWADRDWPTETIPRQG